MSLDRLKQHVAELVEALVGRRLLYAFTYQGVVIKQFAPPDNSVEVLVDDPRIRGAGSGPIRLRHGIPGALARLNVGQRVVVAFDGGDPDKPYVCSYEEGSAAANVLEMNAQGKIHLGNSSGGATMRDAARKGDSIEAGTWTIVNSPVPPGPPGFIMTYTPTIGAPTVVTITGAVVAAVVPPGPIGQVGKITTGSSKVDVQD